MDRSRQDQSSKLMHDQISDHDREILRSLGHGRKLAIEIGTFTGASAEAILEGGAERLVTIDTYLGEFDGIPVRFGDAGVYAETPREEVVSMALRRLERFRDKVTLIVGESGRVADLFQDGIADLIFIDGAHDYESTKRDILSWKSKLKPDGILCGHDFDRNVPSRGLIEQSHLPIGIDKIHYGVVRAVAECLNGFALPENDPYYGLPQSSTLWVWTRELAGHQT